MKKRIILAVFASIAFFATSCSSDHNGSPTNHQSVNQIVQTVSNGTWRITSYIDSGNDETSNFTGYNFTFTADNNAVVATNGINTYSGLWSVTNESDDDSPNDIDFDF